jgi:hypothetical protein
MIAYKHVRTRRCWHPCSAAGQSWHRSALSMGARPRRPALLGSCNVFDKARCENIAASTGSAQQALRNAQTSYPGVVCRQRERSFCHRLAREGVEATKIPFIRRKPI